MDAPRGSDAVERAHIGEMSIVEDFGKGADMSVDALERQSPAASIFDGTARLATEGATVLIPSPSADPQDPLNLPTWRKALIVGILTLYAVSGLCIISALGALIVFIAPDYIEAGISEEAISGLQTYPSLFLGVGNIISMPLAVAVGRRPILLLSTLLLFVGAVLCATNQSFAWHLGARCLVSFAGAQCQALVLLIIYDIYFLHQRASTFQWFSSAEVLFNSSLVIASAYMAEALGWRSWYWMFSALSGVCFILSFLFVPETYYERPLAAYRGEVSDLNTVSQPLSQPTYGATLTDRDKRVIDTQHHAPRTFRSDLRVFAVDVNWAKTVTTLKQIVQVFWFPHVLWVALLNGFFQGADVSIQITYGSLLVSPPYNWAKTSVSLIQLGQIFIAIICLPLLGWATDKTATWMARRNRNGIHEPENRLVNLVFPLLFNLMLTALYGDCVQNPGKYHWMLVVVTVNAYLLILLAGSTVGTTYLVDSHPMRAGAILVVIPVTRGLVSFGLSKKTVDYISNIGALNTFGIYTAVGGIFFFLGIGVFFYGKRMRAFCARWAV
ncbi:Major facilitator superfamily [Macrophomina phaseolina MS6]|uniref:Major facilitator superfamily n=1 Tax=Macrophomina phaseolina (strain MS6) TaxID=1126212 RepID=K2S9N0_MACPH|nr:Major facilitator superfamily [Macrophomina phaseolina MS6]